MGNRRGHSRLTRASCGKQVGSEDVTASAHCRLGRRAAACRTSGRTCLPRASRTQKIDALDSPRPCRARIRAPRPGPVAPIAASAPLPAASAAAPPVAPPIAASAAPTSAPPVSTRTTRATSSRRSATTTTKSSAACGRRAVPAGKFDPSCSEYQGYLDPGRGGGRGPSRGDLQSEYADCVAKKSIADCPIPEHASAAPCTAVLRGNPDAPGERASTRPDSPVVRRTRVAARPGWWG